MENKGKHFKINKKSKVINIIILLLLLLVFFSMLIYSLKEIISWYINNNETNKIKEEMASFITKENIQEDATEEKYNIDFNSIKEKNEDAIGLLKVNGTDIEYIVVKGNDNKYYLNHSFNKIYNKAGWIFADYRNKIDGTDKNLIIYGHNRRNDSMFGTLQNVLKEEWYKNEENRKIIFITENNSYVYETFSVYQIEAQDDYIKTNFSEEEYSGFIEMIKARSIYNFDIEILSTDNILTLSTCANDNRYRVVLHAKQLQ